MQFVKAFTVNHKVTIAISCFIQIRRMTTQWESIRIGIVIYSYPSSFHIALKLMVGRLHIWFVALVAKVALYCIYYSVMSISSFLHRQWKMLQFFYLAVEESLSWVSFTSCHQQLFHPLSREAAECYVLSTFCGLLHHCQSLLMCTLLHSEWTSVKISVTFM